MAFMTSSAMARALGSEPEVGVVFLDTSADTGGDVLGEQAAKKPSRRIRKVAFFKKMRCVKVNELESIAPAHFYMQVEQLLYRNKLLFYIPKNNPGAGMCK